MKEQYIFKGNLKVKVNITDLSKKIGLSRTTVSNIINCKIKTNKPNAFIITKYLDENKEIEDYFVLCD